ncbi:MAG: hypothetical protein AB1757_21340 [Acidobacteriota bacterium]
MLGWLVMVYRLAGDDAAMPATRASKSGERLAVWQTGMNGLDWVYDLVTEGQAINLGGDGYPCLFTAKAEYILPHISDEPPDARRFWVVQAGDIITENWLGQTVLNHEAINACPSSEWLLIEAWDES